MIGRFLPLVGALLLLGVVCWRPWLQRRRYGSTGVWLFRSGHWQQNVRDALGVVLLVCLVGQAIVAAGWSEGLSSLAVIDQLTTKPWQVAGTVLLFGGIGFLVMAQLDLGASWRIGIEEGTSPGLVTTGLYRFCRNPIFLAILITLTGYTLLLPTRLSLALLLGTFLGVRQQVLVEEAYLLRSYGDSYREYARRVGRFLPGIGRLQDPES
ncbi:MAG: isoprenylcysteine carboxylmethyltransferase family protein [Deltaproteobacteria bacterium]|nr:MAG: isoprenylcysteine carboxylmethyltransferase family protein [Deltaproteobacteria bacterium]